MISIEMQDIARTIMRTDYSIALPQDSLAVAADSTVAIFPADSVAGETLAEEIHPGQIYMDQIAEGGLIVTHNPVDVFGPYSQLAVPYIGGNTGVHAAPHDASHTESHTVRPAVYTATHAVTHAAQNSQNAWTPQDRPVTGTVFSSLLLVVCFATYCAIIYRFRPQVAALLDVFRGNIYLEKLIEDQNRLFEEFLRIVTLLGLLMTSIAIVRAVESNGMAVMAAELPDWAFAVAAIAMWGVVWLVWMSQKIILGAAGRLTLSTGFTDTLGRLRRVLLALLWLFCVPVMLMYALSAGMEGNVIWWILVSVAGAMVIYLLFRTYRLFIEEKVSIFYWILYICGVEIFPVSLAALLLVRFI